MTDPFQVLELSHHADEDEVRRRYLELVRQFPPDRDPERFATIRAAYDQIRDPITRIKTQLFRVEPDETIDSICTDLGKRIRDRLDTIPVDVLLSLAKPQ